MDLGTPLGLALASGINAYLPLLSFAIAARFFHLGKVNPQFAFITQNWFITALVILTLIDFVADKIPVIDHAWDAMHTVIRPIAGALVAAASYSQIHLPGIKISGASSQLAQAMLTSSHMLGTIVAVSSTLPALGPGLLIILILGALLAFVSHTAKATTRLLSTLTTAGLLNLGLSLAEDILVLLMVLLSLLIPIVMLILLGLFLIVVGPSLVRVWGNRLRKRRSFL